MMTAASRFAGSPALAALVADLEDLVVGARPGMERLVAERLSLSMLSPDLLAGQRVMFRDECYTVNLLHADPAGRWGLAAIGWLPGQRSSIHDHRAWCSFGVWQGRADEEYFSTNGSDLRCCGERSLLPGATGFAGAVGEDKQAAIHRIGNRGDRPLISLHAYGCCLENGGSSVSTKFDA